MKRNFIYFIFCTLSIFILTKNSFQAATLTRTNNILKFTEDYTTSVYLDVSTLNTYLLSFGSGRAQQNGVVTWCWDGPIADIKYDPKNSVIYAVSELYLHSKPYADLPVGNPNRSEVFLYKFGEWGNKLWTTSVWVSKRTDINYNDDSRYPSLTIDTQGNVYVLWNDRSSSGTYGIYAQKFNSAGEPQWNSGIEIIVTNGSSFGGANVPRGACISNYLFVTYWNSANNAIYLTKINTVNGSKLGTIQVDSTGTGSQFYADISAGPDKNLYIVWRDSRAGGSRWDVYLQKISPSLTKLISDFRVNVYTNYSFNYYWYGWTENNVAVDVDSQTNIYIAWVLQKPGAGVKTFAQKLDKNLNRQWIINSTNDVTVSAGQDAFEAYCSIAVDEGNGVFISWIAHGANNNDQGILQKLNKSDGSRLWTSDVNIRQNYGFYHHGRIDNLGNTCITFGNDSTYQRFSETGVRFFNDWKVLRDRLYYTRARYSTLKIIPGIIKKIKLTENKVSKPAGSSIQYRFTGKGVTNSVNWTPYYPATNGNLVVYLTNTNIIGNDLRMFAYMDNQTNKGLNATIMSQISVYALESWLGDFNAGLYNTGQNRIGDLVINTTAENQTVYGYAFNNGTNSVDAFFFLKNNGNIKTNFKIKGPSSPANWTVKYYLCKFNGSFWETNRNITTAITGSGFQTNIAPYTNETNIITIKISATPSPTLNDGDFTILYITNYAQLKTNWYLQDVAALRATVSKANPDIMVGKYTNNGLVTDYEGNNIYNLDGTGQTKSKQADTNYNAPFFIKIENDGNNDIIYLKGEPSDANFNIKYYNSISGGIDITPEVTSSTGKPFILSAAQSTQIRVEITPISSPISNEKTIIVSAVSKTNPAREDRVKIITRCVSSKPDLMVKFITNSFFTGSNTYNTNGDNQSITNIADNSMTNQFIARIKNNGSESMNIIVKANISAPSPDWSIEFYYGTNNIIMPITDRGYTFTNIPAGGFRDITIKIAPPYSFPDDANQTFSCSLLTKAEPALTIPSKWDMAIVSTKCISSKQDLVAKVDENYFGRDIIETNWQNQSPFKFINHLITNSYSVIITNNSPSPYKVKIFKTEENYNNWFRIYTHNGTNISSYLSTGWITPEIPPFGKEIIELKISPNNSVPSDLTNGIIIKAVSTINTNDIDVIKFRTSRIFPADLLIKKTNEIFYRGNNEYGTNIASQDIAGSYSTNWVVQGTTNYYWYLVKLQNDRTLPDNFLLKATNYGSAGFETNWQIDYFQYTGTNINNPEVNDPTKWSNITYKITSVSGYTLYNISGSSNILFKIGARVTNTNIKEGSYVITKIDAFNLSAFYIDRIRTATTYGIARPDLIYTTNWNNVYETSLPNIIQKFTNYVDKTKGFSFNFIVENESPINTGTFIFHGKKSTNDWVIKYFDKTSDVTPQFNSPSGYTKALNPLTSATLSVFVTVKTDAYYTNRETLDVWFSVFPEDGESLIDYGTFVAIVTDNGKPDITLTNNWNDVYETSPSIQVLNMDVEKGYTNQIIFLIQNDRTDASEKLRFSADPTSGDFNVKYFILQNSNWTDITALATSSEFDVLVPQNTSKTLKMELFITKNATSPIGTEEDFFIKLISQGREKKDIAKFNFKIVDLGKPDITLLNGAFNDIRESTPVIQITNYKIEKAKTSNIILLLQNDKLFDEYMKLKSIESTSGQDFKINYFLITNSITNNITSKITNTSVTLFIQAQTSKTLLVSIYLLSNSSYTFESNKYFLLELYSEIGNVKDSVKIISSVTDLGKPDLFIENSEFSNIYFPTPQVKSYYVEKIMPFTNYVYAFNSLSWRSENYYLKAKESKLTNWNLKYYKINGTFNQIFPTESYEKIGPIPALSSKTLAFVMNVSTNSTNKIGTSFNTTVTLFSFGKLVKDRISFNYILTDRGEPNIKLTNNLWQIYTENGIGQITNIRIEKGESNIFIVVLSNGAARAENMLFKASNFNTNYWKIKITNSILGDITSNATANGYVLTNIPHNSSITLILKTSVESNATNHSGTTNKLFLQLFSQGKLKKDVAIINYILCNPRPDLVVYNLATGINYGTNTYVTNLSEITDNLNYETTNKNIGKGIALLGWPAVYLLKIENDDVVFDEINIKLSGGDGQIPGKWIFSIYDENGNRITEQLTNWRKFYVPEKTYKLLQIRIEVYPNVQINEIHRLFFECKSVKNTNRIDKIGIVTKRLPIVVKGKILVKENKTPIEGAIIKIGNNTTLTSDNKGEFKFEAIEGTYSIKVTKDTFIPYEDEITIISIKTNILKDIELLRFNLNFKEFDTHTFPNPAKEGEGVNIVFNLPEKAEIDLTIFDSQGRLVKKLIENQIYEKGSYKIYWNGRNEDGKIMKRDVYSYVIKTNKYKIVKKIFIY